jgi:hypothetical protein
MYLVISILEYYGTNIIMVVIVERFLKERKKLWPFCDLLYVWPLGGLWVAVGWPLGNLQVAFG